MDPPNEDQTEPAKVSSSERSSEAETETSSSKPWASGRVLTAAQRARKRAIDKQTNRERRNRTQTRIAELESKLESLLRDRAARGSMELSPQMSFSHEGELQRLSHIPKFNPASPWDMQDPAGTGAWNLAPPGQVFAQAQPITYGTSGFIQDYSPISNRETLINPMSQNIAAPAGLLLPASSSQQFPDLTVSHDMTSNLSAISAAAREATSTTQLCNQLLSKASLLDTSQICTDAPTNQNILIRAVMQGWDRVERSGGFYCPLWKMLHDIDDLLFCTSSDFTRLVMLSTIHRMLLVQVERQTIKELPPWYRPRPAQRRFRHELVVGYFAWPGFRERLVLSEKIILSNAFWQSFSRLFRFYWPYNSAEAYQTTAGTGKIQFSGAFMNYIHNIQNWRMDPQFFTDFPELYDDIIPAPVIPPNIGRPGNYVAPRPNSQPGSFVTPVEEETVTSGYQGDNMPPLTNLSIRSQNTWGFAPQNPTGNTNPNWDEMGPGMLPYKPA